MKKLFLSILFICSLLGGNAYAKVKLQCQGLVEIVEKNIIYVGDNLGYLYALDYKNQKLLWAKDYKVPFRSNLKILKNNLLIADTLLPLSLPVD